MSGSGEHDSSRSACGGAFTTTHWSVVLRAGRSESPAAQAALAELCQAYWYPLYAYIRRQGHGADAAKDLAQDFFTGLVTKRFFSAAKPEKGRFRAFLLVTLKRFLINEWHRERAQKRGGGAPVVSIDECLAESRYDLEPAHAESADVLFDRQWAVALLERVLARLEQDYAAAGKQALFDLLRGCIAQSAAAPSYAETAAQLGMTQGAVKVAAHRLRSRYRELLRAEIAQTVSSPEDVDEELRHLFATFSA
jgi:RNA polymerase sigma-70 factor (ECF subfamily)